MEIPSCLGSKVAWKLENQGERASSKRKIWRFCVPKIYTQHPDWWESCKNPTPIGVCIYILYTHSIYVYIYTSISSNHQKKWYFETWFKWQLYAWPRGFTITWDLVGSQTPKKPHSCWFVTPIFRFIWFYIDLRSSKNLQVSNWQPYACGVETRTLGETAQK
jgi:hypothetical protein